MCNDRFECPQVEVGRWKESRYGPVLCGDDERHWDVSFNRTWALWLQFDSVLQYPFVYLIRLKWIFSRRLHVCSFQPVYQGSGHTHKVTKLNELTEYQFRIYAINDAGDGPLSDVFRFTTTKAPPAALKRQSLSSILSNASLIPPFSFLAFIFSLSFYKLTEAFFSLNVICGMQVLFYIDEHVSWLITCPI